MWRLNELFGVAQAHPAERLSCIAFERLSEVVAETPALLARNSGLYNGFLESRNDITGTPMTDGTNTFTRWRGGDVEPRTEDGRRGTGRGSKGRQGGEAET